MSDFEDRLARAVEGLFAGAFRSPVQPAELAKALSRAMDDGRSVGVGKVYAPTAYTVALSADDREQLGDFAATLSGELATFLVGHAAENGYDLIARPSVTFAVHDDLKLGRFRVSAASGAAASGASSPAHASDGPTPHATPGVKPDPAQSTNRDAARPVHDLATVTVSDLHHDVALKGERVVVGRLVDCDLCLSDANISRHHFAFVRDGDGWAIEDLESTNGTFLNGTKVKRGRLHDGDTIQVGATQLVYHEPRG